MNLFPIKLFKIFRSSKLLALAATLGKGGLTAD